MSGKLQSLLTGYYQEGTIPLAEYPRPNFVRDSYLTLNGKWRYAISKDESITTYDGEILVPFSPEAPLSGVNRRVKHDEYLFYERDVTLPKDFKKERLIIHFGAVDQFVNVYINDTFVAHHDLPFFPFSLDITDYVKGDTFKIKLRVQDTTHRANTFVGKQKEKRGGIWYTPQSGVWQSVWLESLPKFHLNDVGINTSLDEKTVTFSFDKVGDKPVIINIFQVRKLLKTITTTENKVTVMFDEITPWTPEKPFLYDVTFTYVDDEVKSYFAFRKVSKQRDKNGIMRFCLNNEPYFQSGILDQGYYSDGLLTPPSDKALIDDIKLAKEMGFNLLRKHIKIDPLRFYYHCDQLGMLVWQDMVNLVPPKLFNVNGAKAMFLGRHHQDIKTRRYGVKNNEQRKSYERGLTKLVKLLKFFPSIVTWVPFNEGWGQFNAEKAVKTISALDNTRLIDHASGWSDQGKSDYYSAHIYFTKLKIRHKQVHDRIIAITEFGGYSLKTKDHAFNLGKTFGYRIYNDQETLFKAVGTLYLVEAQPLINEGLSVLIYTQLSDVEDEVNGLITYDRKVLKFNPLKVRALNEQLFEQFKKQKF